MTRNSIEVTAFSSQRDDWETPASLFKKLDDEFHFDLDPCASDRNHKCDRYFTEKDDGLQKNWGGCRVFCNPPYGRSVSKWVRKAYMESLKPNTLVVMLLNARTDTKYFHDYVYHRSEIRFVKGRVTFELDGGTRNRAPFPSMIVVFRGPEVS